MNLQQYILTVVLCIGYFFLSSCSDDNNLVGSGILPDDDFITVYTDTFQIKASTVKVDSLYSRTTQSLLGEIYDPLYGHMKADFLCQFYTNENFSFYYTPYQGKIDSMDLYIEFMTFTGDPNATQQVQVHPVTRQLDSEFYTFIDPQEYADLQNTLGSTVYTTATSAFDSMQISSSSYAPIYRVHIRLPKELGQKFYDETINNPSSFASQSAFNQFFPGLYATTSYGVGNMIQVSQTYMEISYSHALKNAAGEDSLVTARETFNATKEVIQLNRLESYNDAKLLADNDEFTYLKTPAGIFTRLIIPTKEMAEKVEGRILNQFMLNLRYMPQEDWMFSLAPPSQLLLLPEDSLSSFFQNNNIENGVTTYLSTTYSETSTSSLLGLDASRRTYYFNNIINLLRYHINNNADEDLRLIVVPVTRDYSRIQISYNNYNYQTRSLSHYFSPAGVKLRKDDEVMQIELISSEYAGN